MDASTPHNSQPPQSGEKHRPVIRVAAPDPNASAKPAAAHRRAAKRKPTSKPASASNRKVPRRHASRPAKTPLNAHQAKCTVCRHPYREDIEDEFVRWHSPENIGYIYRVDRRAIYRHARALNLFAARDRNLRFALGHIIDRAESVDMQDAGHVVRAVHAFARINNEGQWINPPSYVIVSSGPLTINPPPSATSERRMIPITDPVILNRLAAAASAASNAVSESTYNPEKLIDTARDQLAPQVIENTPSASS